MRISRKIGLSFFITFLLVILLGIFSIYSLRHIYRGLSQVFAKDLPASRSVHQIAISMEKLLSELNNFLVTDNENFKVSFERSYKKMQDDISDLKRFIVKEEEKVLFGQVEDLTGDINKVSGSIFEKKIKIKALFKDIRAVEKEYRLRLDKLFDSEESKMLDEKDLLLIQAQYIPSSALIMEAELRFSNLLDEIVEHVIKDEDVSASFMNEISALDRSISDYKNYHGYFLSDKERSLASELIDLSSKVKSIINSIVDVKREIKTHLAALLGKEKEFMESIDRLISLKKSGISSKLGVGAALTEDIPAIHNISKMEKDMVESWRLSGKYILTGDESYKNLYYQLRQNIDKELKDYGRHARLRGTEKFLEDIVGSDDTILEAINSNLKMFDKKETDLTDLVSVRTGLEKKIDGLLQHKDSLIKKAQDPDKVLNDTVPARWILMELRNELSEAYRLTINYLNEQEPQYKDIYSEVYFNMKKYVNRYRNLSSSDRDSVFIKEVEFDLDRFNKAILTVIDSHDSIMKERGWTLVKLEEDLKEGLDRAVEVELSQIEKNKIDLKNRIAVINALIFLIIGVVALIAVFIIFYTTNSITNPIQKLYNGAEIIGGGNLDYRLDIKTGDEIQDLAEGFNRMAGELKELYTNLENKVRERTAQLGEANKALASKNKELDDFTYIVSHDLKEPLRGTKAFTKMLMEDYSNKLDKEGKEHLKTISDSSIRMARLIEDLLNLSRIGRIKNIKRDIDLNELLSDVKKNLVYSLEERNVDLKVMENLPTLTCDNIRISEVFSNLISNAIKYSKKDIRPVIEIGYRDKGDFYEFYVKDNGIGIDEEYYDKVFQIFQRLHAKGEYEGTGAGLTIVKKIIENHSGKIWVTSEVGAGSTFYFTLPKSSV
ncbi:ATP-binding protein [Candidatus Omnitrophota bacterium]